ncbi:OmpA family protein [Jannaschia formosa]|uniref:OmpA family protein n=1 Tax=Jannaschia formosa TaxID=2259592 RepID=UPI000E1BB180|nr:OmpA family protein [Jannaschia formosa]TFL18083.1 OmpA family protein [Jannaschia formosa]
MIRAAAIWLLAGPAVALTMPLPATVTLSEEVALTSHRVATGPYRAGALPSETVEGRLTREVFRMAAPDATPLQLLAPLRDQLEAAGWEVVFTCADRDCGGFLFRFEIDVAPAPQMFVDLGAYRYLAARKLDAWTSLVVSTSAGEGYVQRITVVPEGSDLPPVATEARPAPAPDLTATSDVAAALEATGRAVLSDLQFETGSTALVEADYPSLAALADYLRANTQVTVALVGHTDAEGGAESNMAISRRRADSARALLAGRYGIPAARVETFGVGFFAPLARNDTPEGRETNRRVEVVVTSTE